MCRHPSVSIVAAFTIGLIRAASAKAAVDGPLHSPAQAAGESRPSNLVVDPDYGPTADPDSPPGQKLQYDPLTDEKPILEDRNSPNERYDSIEYEEGHELMVSTVPGYSTRSDVNIVDLSESKLPE